jgi:hypothetical protein
MSHRIAFCNKGFFSHFYKTIQLLWARKFNKESSEKIFHALLIEISGLFQKSHKRNEKIFLKKYFLTIKSFSVNYNKLNFLLSFFPFI